MVIENAVVDVRRPREEPWLTAVASALAETLPGGAYPLRFAVASVEGDRAAIEATVLHYGETDARTEPLTTIEAFEPHRPPYRRKPFAVVQVVPTGVRCELGGYAGDATPVTNLLAHAADVLVTHPNAVNASDLNEMGANVLYVEGKSLDDFLLGHLGLLPTTANAIGTFVDARGAECLHHVVNALNAARAVAGIDCGLYTVTARDAGVRAGWSASGCAIGTMLDPESMLDAVELLVARGATAIGGVSVIDGVTPEAYERHVSGELPNPSGGAEAIVTHLVSKLFRLPAAHAPLPYYEKSATRRTDNPRTSAELISTPHYVSVLKGLARAPQLVPLRSFRADPDLLTVANVGAIVAPATCLGGIPALVAELSGIPLVAVRENGTVLSVTNEQMRMANVVEVDSYLEAAGVALALRAGISLESLRRPLLGRPPVEAAHRATAEGNLARA